MIDNERGERIKNAVGDELPEPEPLRRALPPAAPYPADALGPILGPAARKLHDVVQAPLALCAQSVLAAASLAAQPHADVEIDGRTQLLSLWAITVAESGERKTAVDKLALAEHVKRERELHDVYERERKAYDIAKAAHDVALEGAKRDRKAGIDEIRKRIEACGDAPLPPTSPILMFREPTIEAVQRLYLVGASSLGLFADEGAEFFGGHAMKPENMRRTIGGFSKLWDDGTSDRIRVGDGAHKIYGRRLALHVMMQPVIADGVLGDDVLRGQGFLARALMCWPATTAGTRSYRDENAGASREMVAYYCVMRALLARPTSRNERGELAPRTLGLTRAGKRTWTEFHDEIEAGMRPRGPYEQVRPWASKIAEQALRIAGVLALVEAPDVGGIAPDVATAGIALARWYLGEAVRVVDTAAVPPNVRRAEAIMFWCAERSCELIDSASIIQRGPRPRPTADKLGDVMAVLVNAGWAKPANGAKIDGRMVRRAWHVRLDRWPIEISHPSQSSHGAEP